MSKSDKRERQKQNRAQAQAAKEAAEKRVRRNRTYRNLAFILIPVVALFAWSQFRGSKSDSSNKTTTTTSKSTSTTKSTNTTKPTTSTTIDANKQYTATMKTSKGTIVLSLDAKNAPIATNHFVQLAKSGYYDGLTFHRVIPDFVIQGGDPKGDGTGSAPSTVVGEVPKGAYPLGAIAAAKTSAAPAGTFGDQFFIVTGAQGQALPPDYATWGVVTKGLDVAQAISKVPTDSADKPKTPVYIESVSITESAA